VPHIAEQLSLPSSYGSPSRLLDWPSVEQRLIDSPHYWLATVRRDGRATLHLEDGESAVIVEGVAQWTTPSKTVAQRLAKASTAKYGYSQSAASYLAGVWRLRPVKVVAWTTLFVDATRFRFEAAD